jgi:hypothetical protein
MSELNVHSEMLCTPSVEMPPGYFERAKPLATEWTAEFSELSIGRTDRLT